MVSAPARRELVRHMVNHGLSERRSLRVIGMSASAYRYEPAQDRNCALKEKIIALAQRHRRYGAGMIYLKLRQAGDLVNHKRVDRLYAEAGLAVAELCRRHGFSEASYYLWRSKFGGMSVSDAKRLKELELENSRLKRLLAESMLENEVTKEALRKKW